MSEQTTDLSRRVAEAAGWRFEFDHHLHGYNGMLTRYYKVYAPNGELVTSKDDYRHEGIWAEFEIHDAYPDYKHDANAALGLTMEGYELVLKQRGNGWEAYYRPMSKQIDMGTITATAHESKEPAEAVCEAYLKLTEYVKAKG